MALRNYLYAKHEHNTEIDTLINRAPDMIPSDLHNPTFIDRSKRISHRRRVVQHQRSPPIRKSPDLVVEQLSSDISNMQIEEGDHLNEEKKEHCKNECENCQCKKEAGSSFVDNGFTSNTHGPSIEVEVGEGEIDFTNTI